MLCKVTHCAGHVSAKHHADIPFQKNIYSTGSHMQYDMTKNDLEEGGVSPTTTGLLGSRLLFIQQDIVGSCRPNLLQMSWG